MKFGERVRVAQNAGGHAGDAGVVKGIEDEVFMRVDFGVCEHLVHVNMLTSLDGPHRYSPQSLALLDMCLTDFREYAGQIGPHAIPDFEALIAHVKENLA